MTDPDTLAAAVAASAALVQAQCAGRAPARLALLLGSGWGAAAEGVQDAVDLPYDALPAFPRPGVSGHAGVLRIGRIGRQPVLVLVGRKHAYESGDAAAMKGAIRTLAALGVRALLQTNAAGSLDAAMRPGEAMLIADHINLPQRSPLFGDSGDARFVDMSAAYDAALRAQARAAAARAGLVLHEGVYAWAMGPQFETPAEIRMLRLLGAHAVGMSTVPETILARHAGLRVLGLALLTNMAAGLAEQTLSHAQTLAAAQAAGDRAVRLLAAVVDALEP
jgi:purine-nucleoside phosphorylase